MIVTVVTGREERGIVWIPLLMSNIIIHYVQLQAQYTPGIEPSIMVGGAGGTRGRCWFSA